jgi:hypothetical protein
LACGVTGSVGGVAGAVRGLVADLGRLFFRALGQISRLFLRPGFDIGLGGQLVHGVAKLVARALDLLPQLLSVI